MADARPNSEEIIKGLQRALANAYTLMIKTHNYHWNVEGPSFYGLHKLFEEQYTDLFTAVDDVAERIRALGGRAPGSIGAFQELSSIPDSKPGPLAWKEMVQDLVESRRIIVAEERKVMRMADEADDQTTTDMMAERIGKHEEAIWMLQSHLGQ